MSRCFGGFLMRTNIFIVPTPAHSDHQNLLKMLYQQIIHGSARFTHSNFKGANLINLESKIKQLRWTQLSRQEKECWSNSAFLLDIFPGDYIVYLDLPDINSCSLAQVTGKYNFSPNNQNSVSNLFAHTIPVKHIADFEVDYPNIPPQLASKLNTLSIWQKIPIDESISLFLNDLADTSTLESKPDEQGCQIDCSEPVVQANATEHPPRAQDNISEMQALIYANAVRDVVQSLSGNRALFFQMVKDYPELLKLEYIYYAPKIESSAKLRNTATQVFQDILTAGAEATRLPAALVALQPEKIRLRHRATISRFQFQKHLFLPQGL